MIEFRYAFAFILSSIITLLLISLMFRRCNKSKEGFYSPSNKYNKKDEPIKSINMQMSNTGTCNSFCN